MSLPPIPKQVLIHTVTHSYDRTDDAWKRPTYGGTRIVEHVRLEPSTKRVLSKDNTEVQLRAVMFYDAVNSTPQGVTFVHDEQIVFGSETYLVEGVETLYDSERIHHLEISLV